MTEIFINIGGHSYRYIKRQGSGPKLLFLHGLSDFAEQIMPLIEFLPKHWHILALDQRGHGGSWQPKSEYSPLDYARDIKVFIEKLKLAPVNLFGHSMGGRQAMVCAAKYPGLVDNLILGDIGPDSNLQDIHGTTNFFNSLPESFKNEKEAIAHLQQRKPDYNADQIQLLMQNLSKDQSGVFKWKYSKSACIQSVQKARSRGWWSYFKKIKCRTLLIHVEGSGELSNHTAAKMCRKLKNIRYERITGCGHNFHIEKAKEAANTIINSITND